MVLLKTLNVLLAVTFQVLATTTFGSHYLSKQIVTYLCWIIYAFNTSLAFSNKSKRWSFLVVILSDFLIRPLCVHLFVKEYDPLSEIDALVVFIVSNCVFCLINLGEKREAKEDWLTIRVFKLFTVFDRTNTLYEQINKNHWSYLRQLGVRKQLDWAVIVEKVCTDLVILCPSYISYFWIRRSLSKKVKPSRKKYFWLLAFMPLVYCSCLCIFYLLFNRMAEQVIELAIVELKNRTELPLTVEIDTVRTVLTKVLFAVLQFNYF